jgi:hypothetical protein
MQETRPELWPEDGSARPGADSGGEKSSARVIKQRLAPRPTTAIEAYALRSLAGADEDFARYLLRFLREFSSVSKRAAGSSSLGRALKGSVLAGARAEAAEGPAAANSAPVAEEVTAEVAPAAEGLTRDTPFRVPPFVATAPDGPAKSLDELEADSRPAADKPSTDDDGPPPGDPAPGRRTSRRRSGRRVA